MELQELIKYFEKNYECWGVDFFRLNDSPYCAYCKSSAFDEESVCHNGSDMQSALSGLYDRLQNK